MTTSYSIHERVLLCSSCGSVLTAPAQGGGVECPACRAPRRVPPRDDRPWTGRPRHGSYAEYLARLRAQDGEPLRTPESLAHLVRGGRLSPEREGEAIEIFRLTCAEVERTRSPEASQRLYWLVVVLTSHLFLRREHRLRRAVLESALDVFPVRRHVQLVRCMLGASAAADGDFASAEAWIAPCDPFSGELEPDGALRVTRAFLATVRRDYGAVVELLGSKDEEVPVDDTRDPMAAVLRANALEKLGHEATAVAALMDRMRRGGPGQRRAMETYARAHPSLRLCERTMPIALERLRRERARGMDAGMLFTGGSLLAIGAALLALAVITFAAVIVSGELPKPGPNSESNTLGLLLGPPIGGGILVVLGWRLAAGAWRRRRIARDGIPGWGVITGMESTGVAINDVPQMRIHFLVHRSGAQPHAASAVVLLDPATTASLAVGGELPLLLDPSAPEHAIIDT